MMNSLITNITQKILNKSVFIYAAAPTATKKTFTITPALILNKNKITLVNQGQLEVLKAAGLLLTKDGNNATLDAQTTSDPLAPANPADVYIINGMDATKLKPVYMTVKQVVPSTSSTTNPAKLVDINANVDGDTIEITFVNINDSGNSDIKAAVEGIIKIADADITDTYKELTGTTGNTITLTIDSTCGIAGQIKTPKAAQNLITKLQKAIVDTTKTKFATNPLGFVHEVKLTTDNIPLVKEGRRFGYFSVFTTKTLDKLLKDTDSDFKDGTEIKIFFPSKDLHDAFDTQFKAGKIVPKGTPDITLSEIDSNKASAITQIAFEEGGKYYVAKDSGIITKMLDLKNKYLTLDEINFMITDASDTTPTGTKSFEVKPETKFIVQGTDAAILKSDNKTQTGGNTSTVTDPNANKDANAPKKDANASKKDANASKKDATTTGGLTFGATADSKKVAVGQIADFETSKMKDGTTVTVSHIIVSDPDDKNKNKVLSFSGDVTKDTGLEIDAKAGTVKLAEKGKGNKKFTAVVGKSADLTDETKVGITPKDAYNTDTIKGKFSEVKSLIEEGAIITIGNASTPALTAADATALKDGSKVLKEEDDTDKKKLSVVDKATDGALSDTLDVTLKLKAVKLIDSKGAAVTTSLASASGNFITNLYNKGALGKATVIGVPVVVVGGGTGIALMTRETSTGEAKEISPEDLS